MAFDDLLALGKQRDKIREELKNSTSSMIPVWKISLAFLLIITIPYGLYLLYKYDTQNKQRTALYEKLHKINLKIEKASAELEENKDDN